MKLQISYFDPLVTEIKPNDLGQNMVVIANNQDEYDSIMDAITNPKRRITNITEEQLPDEPQPKYTDKEIRDFNEAWLEQTGYIPESEVTE